MPVKRLVQIGDSFFELSASSSGLLDDSKRPIRYCPDCSKEYGEGTEIYHRCVSAIFKRS